MVADFILHPQLKADTFLIGDLKRCRALLMNNALFPWVILVPRSKNAVELTDLPETIYLEVMQEIRHTANALQHLYQPYKMNIAALGNQVRQLHIHVVARQDGDAAWPNPVWGGAREPYQEKEISEILRRIRDILKIGDVAWQD